MFRLTWRRLLFLLSIFISGLLADYIAGPPVSISSDKASTIFTALELVALLLPALAIVSQAVLRLSDSLIFKASGESTKLKYYSMGIMGITGMLLFIATTILIQKLNVGIGLGISFLLISLSIAAFSLIPLSIAYTMYKSLPDEDLRYLDNVRAFKQMTEIEEHLTPQFYSIFPYEDPKGQSTFEDFRAEDNEAENE